MRFMADSDPSRFPKTQHPHSCCGFQGGRTCGPMAIPRGGFILMGPPMLGCPAGTERTEAQVKAADGVFRSQK